MKKLDLDPKNFDPRTVMGMISRAKDKLMTPRQFSADAAGDYFREKVADVYRDYEKAMKKACALDFDDIIMKTVLLLQNNPEVLEYYQRQFRYVLVDEYQDTNYAQYVLTSLLAGYYENICVVGDDDQSIYKFRGATTARRAKPPTSRTPSARAWSRAENGEISPFCTAITSCRITLPPHSSARAFRTACTRAATSSRAPRSRTCSPTCG